MATATFTIVNDFYADVMNKVHNLGADTLTVALCAAANAPTSASGQLSDLTQAGYDNCSARNITITSSTQTAGVYTLVLADLTLTASGAVGPFRYAVIYNNTATNDEIIGYLDYGSDITLGDTETFKLDFSAVTGALSMAAAV